MVIDFGTATDKDKQKSIDDLRRAVTRFVLFYNSKQKGKKGSLELLHQRSGVSRHYMYRFLKGEKVSFLTLQKLAKAVPGWYAPPPAPRTFKDFLSERGTMYRMWRRTGVSVVRLVKARDGKRAINHSQKARILQAYPGLISPDSLLSYPDQANSTATDIELDVLENMANDAPPIL